MVATLLLVMTVCVLLAAAAGNLLRPILPAWRGWLRERAAWRRLDAELARGGEDRSGKEGVGAERHEP